MCEMWGKKIKGSVGGFLIHLRLGGWDIGGCEILMERDVRNGERCMYFGCDFNGR